MPRCSHWYRALAGVLVATLGLPRFLPAAVLPDLLELPASHSSRAERSVQLAIARAGKRLVSVGERGIVLLSDDDGRHWRQAQEVPVSVALTNVAFVSASLGWATGHSGVVLRSEDGGEHWQRQLDGRRAAALVLDEAKRQAAEAGAGEDAARAVRDAERMVAEGPDKPMLGLAFADERRGWVVGAYGLALATDDGGQSWYSIVGRIPNRAGHHLYGIQYDAGHLSLAGEQGLLLRSDDAGAHFAAVQSPYPGTFFGILAGASGPLAYGLRGNAWEQDGEGKWTAVKLAQPISLVAALRRADGSTVLANEAGGVYARRAGGGEFAPLAVSAPTGLTGLVESSDGALAASTTHGALPLIEGGGR